jgi:nicotinamidase-related amidase
MPTVKTDHKKTALIVIDVQESFRVRPFWSEKHLPMFVSNINALITQCVSDSTPVVRIFHTSGADIESNPFAKASGMIRPLTELVNFDAAIEFEKHKHSALVDTGLKAWLHTNGIQKIILCGIRTEQCCETTARHASDEGWEVEFASKAMLTFDMKHPDGEVITAEEITRRTETVLAGRFVTLV